MLLFTLAHSAIIITQQLYSLRIRNRASNEGLGRFHNHGEGSYQELLMVEWSDILKFAQESSGEICELLKPARCSFSE